MTKQKASRYFRFYDPHPGLMGCPSILPKSVQSLGARFDNRILTEKYVLSAIRKAVGTGFEVSLAKDAVMLKQGSFADLMAGRCGRVDCWRVLRAKRVKAPRKATSK